MSAHPADLKRAKECIQKSIQLIAAGNNETVIRDSFTSYLRLIFPSNPPWVEHHIKGAESPVSMLRGELRTTGFVDNLIGLTPIEYESDLTSRPRFDAGLLQVKNYCASLVNQNQKSELILGVLSDTIRWFVFAVDLKGHRGGAATGDDIELRELERIDLSSADELATQRLVGFLWRYLGRIGARPLSAESIAGDLGFESQFCSEHLKALEALVNKAFNANPKYAELIINLWCSFVTYFRDKGSKETFNKAFYADELYILTLGKLICANEIEKRALLSDDTELARILDGRFFVSKGLVNLVEYDYFGWLNRPPYVDSLLPAARGLQDDLQVYDFSKPPAEDVFGRMLAQLAQRSQRILLGQEWTPGWLARQIVRRTVAALRVNESPQLVDMCCGSGAMIVEAIKLIEEKFEGGPERNQKDKLQALIQGITGFDIDPLAVILSKINWVLAARNTLEPFGHVEVVIPVYHADSLFAITPLSETVGEEAGTEFHNLKVAEYNIMLPSFMLSAEYQVVFDNLIERAYGIALAEGSTTKLQLTDPVLEEVLTGAERAASKTLDATQKTAVRDFVRDLAEKVNLLHRDERNGVWIFILRNSYRPGLVAGRFNGLVSNPPWLALSKIAQNPYQEVLKKKAVAFCIKPPGSSHLHIELATIFLLHAIDKYLKPEAAVGCITPEMALTSRRSKNGLVIQASQPRGFTTNVKCDRKILQRLKFASNRDY
jgi:methylase of polypeptide subunit release factors